MEIEVKDYMATLGGADEAPSKKRGGMSRRLKPLGRLFKTGKSFSASKTSAKGAPLIKPGKADRRKSGSTSDVPTTYDSCDDPSQDHRTEPTTSVESMLGMSFATRNRSFRRGLVPAALSRVRSTSSRAKLHRHPQFDEDQVDNSMLSEPGLLHRIASCPANAPIQPAMEKGSAIDEGVELILEEKGGRPYTLEPDSTGDSLFLPLHAAINGVRAREPTIEDGAMKCEPDSVAARRALKSNTPPPTTTADNVTPNEMPMPKISITTTSFAPDEAPDAVPTAWLPQDEFDPADSRPLKEIVFSTGNDQFDDMDDLTLPPAGFLPPPLHQRPQARQLYSRPIYSPPFSLGGGPDSLHRQQPNQEPTSASPLGMKRGSPIPVVSRAFSSSGNNKDSAEELFATFVEERHGSFRRDIMQSGKSHSVTAVPPHLAYSLQEEKSSTHQQRISLADSALLESDSAGRESPNSEDDLELIRINKQDSLAYSAPISETNSRSYIVTSSERVPFNNLPTADHQAGQATGTPQPNGRESRASRLSSLLSLFDNGTLPASCDSDEQFKNQIVTPDKTFETTDRVSSPQDYMMQFFGRMYRKAETSPPLSQEPPSVKAPPVPPPLPHSIICSAETGSYSSRSENYSASREAGSYSGDSLTRDSLMEMLDFQAAARGDPESARWLTRGRSTTLSSGSDLFVRNTTSEDSSLSATEASTRRATPALKTFDCAGMNMYANSNEDESFATRRREDNFIAEIKSDLINTVHELKREGSLVVNKLIRQISNK